MQLWQDQSSAPGSRVELSPANFRDWQRMSTSFEAMGAFNRGSDNLVGEGEPERLESATLTAEVIPLLGTRPLLGRAFTPEEDREGAPGTLLLSYGLWQERFAGDPGVLGRKLLLDDEPYQVIGVMPRGFHFPRRETRLWRPLRLESAAFERRDDLWLECVARLRPGVSLERRAGGDEARGGTARAAVPERERGYRGERREAARPGVAAVARCCCWPCSAPRSACC